MTDSRLQAVDSLGTGQPLGEYYLAVDMTDVSAASTAWTVVPWAGVVTHVKTIIHGAITGADSVLTAKIGTTLITGVSITVAYSGSAAGDVDTGEATALNVVAAGDKLSLITDGASSTTARLTGIFTIERR